MIELISTPATEEAINHKTAKALMFFNLPVKLDMTEYLTPGRANRMSAPRSYVIHCLAQYIGPTQIASYVGLDHSTVAYHMKKWDNNKEIYPEMYQTITEHYSDQIADQMRTLFLSAQESYHGRN